MLKIIIKVWSNVMRGRTGLKNKKSRTICICFRFYGFFRGVYCHSFIFFVMNLAGRAKVEGQVLGSRFSQFNV